MDDTIHEKRIDNQNDAVEEDDDDTINENLFARYDQMFTIYN